MGYFSNGSEGDNYRAQYCERCVHDVNQDCAVWLAHLLENYDECKNPNSILNILIPRGKGTKEDPWNHQCKMFIPISGASSAGRFQDT